MSGVVSPGGGQRAPEPRGHDPRRWRNPPVLRGGAVGLRVGVPGQRLQDWPSLPQSHPGCPHLALGWRWEGLPLHSPAPKVPRCFGFISTQTIHLFGFFIFCFVCAGSPRSGKPTFITLCRWKKKRGSESANSLCRHMTTISWTTPPKGERHRKAQVELTR